MERQKRQSVTNSSFLTTLCQWMMSSRTSVTRWQSGETMKDFCNGSVELIVEGKSYDLLCEYERKEYFEFILKSGASRQQIFGVAPCESFSLTGNIIAFDFITRCRIFKRIFLSIANDPVPQPEEWNMRVLALCLTQNHLITRHIFQKTRLWKSLLSAQIQVLKSKPRERMDDSIWRTLLTSMKYWEAKHFVFALHKGLLDWTHSQIRSGISKYHADQQNYAAWSVGVQLQYFIIYFGGKCNLVGDYHYM